MTQVFSTTGGAIGVINKTSVNTAVDTKTQLTDGGSTGSTNF
tara:strand:- start:200 stop:325 length:126 start_codon:yes stop_codon:yes gene_type:complete